MAKKIKSFKNFKGPKGKDLSVFVRFGGVNLKQQRGYTNDNPTFHSPPARRGFYAFPKSMQEHFLIGSIDKFQPGIFPKDKTDWNKLTPEEYDKTYKDMTDHNRKIKQNLRREFIKTTGNIWHHLGDCCNPADVIATHGSWVKTSIKDWQKAFSKRSLNDRYGEDFGYGLTAKKSINDTRGISGYYSKDHYEVFFDENV